MSRLTVSRSVIEWITRPRTRHDTGTEEQQQEHAEVMQRLLPGVISQTRFQTIFELDVRLARLLLKKIDDELEQPMHDAKVGAFEHARKHLLIAFPELA